MSVFSRPQDDVVVYADGSSYLHLKAGGWAAIIHTRQGWYSMSDGAVGATNNQMELTAVIRALEHLLQLPSGTGRITGVVRTDSNYVVEGLTNWSHGWVRNNWRKANRKPVENRDLWEVAVGLRDRMPNIRYEWVKGHAGERWNEECDVLAKKAAQEVLNGRPDKNINRIATALEERAVRLRGLAHVERDNGPVVADAIRVFGDRAWDFLTRPHNALGDKMPVELIAEGKADAVANLLVNIEHGGFA